MPTASFHSLGCRLNQTEAALWAGAFKQKGYSIVDWGERSDLVVINTCSVTERGEASCRNAIRQALRLHPETFVVVTGCYAQVGLDQSASYAYAVELMSAAAVTADAQEGIAAFLEKRKPKFGR